MRFLSSEFSHKVLIGLIATVTGCLLVVTCNAGEPATDMASKIDQAVVSELSTLYGSKSRITQHIYLTKPFHTKTPWVLVIGKEPDQEGTEGPLGFPIGAISICFVNNKSADCSEKMLTDSMGQNILGGHGEGLFYKLFNSSIVYACPKKTKPLLLIKACTMPGADGDCDVSTFLFDYNRNADRFYNVFYNVTGRNNNQETRFIERGPLIGDVIVATPTRNAPFNYWVEIYKRNKNGRYVRLLRYRSKTGYGDGNPLAVIDSEMPEILRRLKLWTPGQVLPVPPKMPVGCTKLSIRSGLEWCE